MAAATDPVRDFITLAAQALQNRERVVDLQTLAEGLFGLPLGKGAAGRAGFQMSELERNNPVQFFFLNQLVAIVRGHLPAQGAAGTSGTPGTPSQPPSTPGVTRRTRRTPGADTGGAG